jgi:hypothetical protein
MKRLLQFFEYTHLPINLQEISKVYYQVAHWMAVTLPENAESTVSMRKLLEAKDSAVRSVLYKEPTPNI